MEYSKNGTKKMFLNCVLCIFVTWQCLNGYEICDKEKRRVKHFSLNAFFSYTYIADFLCIWDIAEKFAQQMQVILTFLWAIECNTAYKYIQSSDTFCCEFAIKFFKVADDKQQKIQWKTIGSTAWKCWRITFSLTY